MKNLHLLLILSLSTMVMSCSDNLSRSKARKAILESVIKNEPEIGIGFGRDFNNGSVKSVYGLCFKNRMFPGDNSDKIVDQLYKSGLLIDNNGTRRLNSWGEKVQRYVQTDKSGLTYFIPIAIPVDVEITGIKGSDTETYREVECNVIYEWNEVGKLAGLDFVLKVPRNFTFKKYDDGWRLKQ